MKKYKENIPGVKTPNIFFFQYVLRMYMKFWYKKYKIGNAKYLHLIGPKIEIDWLHSILRLFRIFTYNFMILGFNVSDKAGFPFYFADFDKKIAQFYETCIEYILDVSNCPVLLLGKLCFFVVTNEKSKNPCQKTYCHV